MNSCKNYKTDNGDTTVIGGKLKFISGATVEGLPSATTTANGGVKAAAAQADSTATDVAGLVTDLNALLAKLRASGALAST